MRSHNVKVTWEFWNWVFWSAESMAKVLWAAAWKKCETKVVCILVCWGQKYPTRRVRGIKIKAYIIGNKVGPKYYIFIHVIIFLSTDPSLCVPDAFQKNFLMQAHKNVKKYKYSTLEIEQPFYVFKLERLKILVICFWKIRNETTKSPK